MNEPRNYIDPNSTTPGGPELKRVVITDAVEPLKPFSAKLMVPKQPPNGWDPDDPESVDDDLWRETETVVEGIRNGLPSLDSPDVGDIGWVLDDYRGRPSLIILEPAVGVMNLVKYKASSGVIKWQRYLHHGAAVAIMGVVYHPGEKMLYVTLAQFPTGQSDTLLGETYLARVSPASGHIVDIVEGVYPVVAPGVVGFPAGGDSDVGNRRALCATSLNISGAGNILCVSALTPLDDDLAQEIHVVWVSEGEVIRSESTGMANIPRVTGWSVSGVFESNDAVWSRSGFTGSPGSAVVTKRVGDVTWTCSNEFAMACNYSPTGLIGAANHKIGGTTGFTIDADSGTATSCATIPNGQTPVWFNGEFVSPALSLGSGALMNGVAVNEEGTVIADAEYAAGLSGVAIDGMIIRASSGVARSTTLWQERGPNGTSAQHEAINEDVAPLGVCFQGNDYVFGCGYRRAKITNAQAYNPR